MALLFFLFLEFRNGVALNSRFFLPAGNMGVDLSGSD